MKALQHFFSVRTAQRKGGFDISTFWGKCGETKGKGEGRTRHRYLIPFLTYSLATRPFFSG